MRPASYRDAFFSPRKYSSDKWEHDFAVYDLLLGRYYGTERTTYLEIGVQCGGSLEVARMLLGSGSKICGLDIDPACAALQQAGVADRIFIGSQVDPDLIGNVVRDAGPFDAIQVTRTARHAHRGTEADRHVTVAIDQVLTESVHHDPRLHRL